MTHFWPRFILLAGSAITLLPGHAAARADDAMLCNGSNHLARIDACTRLMGAKGSTRDDQFRALINRAVAHFKRDEHRAAIRDFTLAITAGYGTAAIHESRGLAFLAIDDQERAWRTSTSPSRWIHPGSAPTATGVSRTLRWAGSTLPWPTMTQ